MAQLICEERTEDIKWTIDHFRRSYWQSKKKFILGARCSHSLGDSWGGSGGEHID